ncbi:DUF2280 domain-containing protein [Salinisphaera sp. SPP-AMP-43]|uniref:DUF2280 domain-containing protein n=1 Tax=Salinisphaera sp. SPP-AMP-43 TaxID=3121288 RepID=UPI003C6DF952
MAKLTDAIREHIVTGLACFQTPSDVAKSVGEVFEVEITRQQVDDYNPTGRRKKMLAQRWHDLFAAAREAYLEDTVSIPVANQAVRLERLSRMADKAERMGNIALAAQLIEQAAKETGGMFTNRRELTGKDGGPIEERAAVIWQARKRLNGDDES